MFLKPKCLFGFSLLFTLTSQAQFALGLEAGLSNGYLNTNISNRASTSIRTCIGYYAGFNYRKKINQWLYAEVIPSIIQKNYSNDRTDSLEGVIITYKNIYIQLPIMAHFVYGKRLQVYANIGLYGGYWLSCFEKGKIPNVFSSAGVERQNTENFKLSSFNENYIFIERIDNRIELGWVTGAGLQYRFGGNLLITLCCRYYESQTDQQKMYMVNQVPKYNQVVTFALGGIFLFNKANLKR